MTTLSPRKMELLSIFNLLDHHVLLPELCFLILELSGLVTVGAHGCVFVVHIPRFIAFPKRKKKRQLNKKLL